MEAGREAAHQARTDLERRLAETKAAYNAGADVARSGRSRSRSARMEQRTPTPEPLVEAPAARFEPPPPPSRSPLTSLGWTLRDYAKRVWDNAGEDNVLFLAGGHRVQHPARRGPVRPAARLGLRGHPATSSRSRRTGSSSTTSTACCPSHVESPDAPSHKIIERHPRRAHASSGSGAPSASSGSRRGCSARCAPCSPACSTSSRSAASSRARSSTSRSRPLHRPHHGQRADQHLRAHRDQERAAQVLEDLGIRKDVMGQASAWGTHLVGARAPRRDVLRALQVPARSGACGRRPRGSPRSSRRVMFELAKVVVQRLRRARSTPARSTRAPSRRSWSSCSGSTTPR